MELVETWAIVVAAGAGERFGGDRPKAFARLGGRPLIAHSLMLMEEHPAVDGIVLVVPNGWEEPATLLADDLAAGKVAAAVTGGATRPESVAAGLAAVPERAGVVLVHDAARPLASSELVTRVLGGLADADGAVPVTPVVDTVKRVEGAMVAETIDRARLRAAQTPQAFRVEALRRAFELPTDELARHTDCASLLERLGMPVAAVPGERRNLKVTEPLDVTVVEALLR
jgi:2-C-methyl-D-erythritol 4-phosphate cytidylyltransferase